MAKNRVIDSTLRTEAEAWAKKEFAALIAEGKTSRQAAIEVRRRGKKKYGADWTSILAFLKMIIEMLETLFK